MNEQWRPVVGYESQYEVSDHGNMRRVWTSFVKPLKLCVDNYGYHYVNLCAKGKRRGFRVHRLVAEAFVTKLDWKNVVNHIDGRKLNNHVSNLEWVTSAENNHHAARTNLTAAGEDVSVLNNFQVRVIRRLFGRMTHKDIGRMFSVSSATIDSIKQGKTWTRSESGYGHPVSSVEVGYQGENNSCAKLNESQVRIIRRIENPSASILADMFCVKRETIYKVLKNVSWKHVQNQPGTVQGVRP